MNAYDCIVVGGGPSGATAATDLAAAGHSVLLLDRAGRIKPCGGAIPPRLIRDFDIPDSLICAKARSARMIAPSNRRVNMPIEGGYVGMVNRESFDEWLRERAKEAGAERRSGTFERLERDAWQLGRSIADAFDDYGLYRPAMLRAWAMVFPPRVTFAGSR
jgi:geranylgeranyl reductase